MAPPNDREMIELSDREAWSQWLEDNHGSSRAVWLKIAKKGTPVQTVQYPDALEEAIRYGWIDGQKAPYDERFWLQRFTPRGPRSKWSQVNREKAQRLLAAGEMMPAGLEQIRAAQRDGRWDAAYPAQSRAEVPDDFHRALEENPVAQAFFATLSSSQRYSFLYRIHDAKRPETRARRIAEYVARLAEGKTLRD